MKIGIDYHGVIVDVEPYKARLAREMYDVHLSAEDFHSGSVHDHTRDQHLQEEQFQELRDRVYRSDEALQIPFVLGASLYLSKLQELGHELYIISNGGRHFCRHAEIKCAEIGIRNPKLIPCGFGNKKDQVCWEHEIDVFLDDTLSKLIHMEGVVAHRYLLDRSYNKVDKIKDPSIQRSSWAQFFDTIKTQCFTI